jgi:ferritin-like metal-binding protein YciE
MKSSRLCLNETPDTTNQHSAVASKVAGTKNDREYRPARTFADLTHIPVVDPALFMPLRSYANLSKENRTMKFFSENIDDLRTLYVANLKKALDMERKITKALPTMIEKATDPELATAFRNHLEETKGHVSKVQRLVRNATGDEDASTCKAISALVTEAEDGIKDAGAPSIRDIVLIASAQQVEHHEIAVYGTLSTWAALLGDVDAITVLESILNEEKRADKLLSSISDSVNPSAKSRAVA